VFTRFRRDPLIGNVLGLVALFVALGGVAWAAATINSKDVVNNSLKSVDLKEDKGVKGVDVVPESLEGDDIEEGSLSQVPSAVDAEFLDGSTASDFALAGSEGWQPLVLRSDPSACHWQNFGNGFNPPAFFRDRAGVVHLRGMITAVDGTGNNCGGLAPNDSMPLASPLPQGYRPANTELVMITAANKPGRLDVFANGDLVLGAVFGGYPSFADVKIWLSLDGVSYRCAPSGQNGCP
jgi:hypothetical protein